MNIDLSTAAVILREPRPCSTCGSTTVVDVTRIERAFDYQDEWTCPICNTNHTVSIDEEPIDEADPDSWHDTQHER